MEWHRFPRQLLLWGVVCSVAAAPSFLLGCLIQDARAPAIIGMSAGVVCWVVVYAAVASTHAMRLFREKPFVATTFKWVYGIRQAQSLLSIIPPFIAIDMAAGITSTLLAGRILSYDPLSSTSNAPHTGLAGPPAPLLEFLFSYIATMTQGVLLNVVLAVLFALIWGGQRFFRKPPKPKDPRAICAGCGYDLRASRDSCPECGLRIPPDGARFILAKDAVPATTASLDQPTTQ